MINRDKQHNRVFGSRRRDISGPLVVSAMLFSAAAALWSQDTPTYSYSVLYAFGGPSDGDLAASGLVRDKEGNLYGTTLGGGNASTGSYSSWRPRNLWEALGRRRSSIASAGAMGNIRKRL